MIEDATAWSDMEMRRTCVSKNQESEGCVDLIMVKLWVLSFNQANARYTVRLYVTLKTVERGAIKQAVLMRIAGRIEAWSWSSSARQEKIDARLEFLGYIELRTFIWGWMNTSGDLFTVGNLNASWIRKINYRCPSNYRIFTWEIATKQSGLIPKKRWNRQLVSLTTLN